jgi:hypothetical protein
MCHSVHRATAGGVKLLPTADATCSGCHTGSTANTAKLVTWIPVNTAYTADGLNGPPGGGGGPHNDNAENLIEDGYWDGVGVAPSPSYEHGSRYGCFTRRCHATNPHGAGGSKYKIMAAKLLFNESANADELGDGTYGGLDAVWDDLGATDAAVERFVTNNASVMSTTVAYGPKGFMGLLYMAKILYPDRFSDVDPIKAMDTYSEKYVPGANKDIYIYPVP